TCEKCCAHRTPLFWLERLQAFEKPDIILTGLCIVRRRRALIYHPVEIDRVVQRYFTPLAQAIDRLVARQGNEPGQGAGARRVEAICATPHGGEDLLQDLFGVAWIPQHTQTHAEETPPGVPVKLREGALVALARASQQTRQCVAIVGGRRNRRKEFPGVVCSNSVVSRSSPQAMLREWRQDFARMMREQGIAANATPRAVQGRNMTRCVSYRSKEGRKGRMSAEFGRKTVYGTSTGAVRSHPSGPSGAASSNGVCERTPPSRQDDYLPRPEHGPAVFMPHFPAAPVRRSARPGARIDLEHGWPALRMLEVFDSAALLSPPSDGSAPELRIWEAPPIWKGRGRWHPVQGASGDSIGLMGTWG